MSDHEFKLHTDEDETFPLARMTLGEVLAVDLARIMGPSTDEKARELARKNVGELEIDGTERVLVDRDGERHELPRLPTWRATWAQIAPAILRGVEHEDVDPKRVCVPEIGRAYLYWSTAGYVSAEEWDRCFGAQMLKRKAEAGDLEQLVPEGLWESTERRKPNFPLSPGAVRLQYATQVPRLAQSAYRDVLNRLANGPGLHRLSK